MKEKRLIYAIGWVMDEYIQEMEQPGIQQKKKGTPKRKMWLIAAIIALTLLMVGCAAVYLWLQDRSIRQETYTQRFDAQGHYMEPTEKILDTVTLFGSGGSDMQKALAEWMEFKLNYPDFFELNLTDEDAEKVPERYRYTYDCYTFEMVDALEEIAAKYNLKLLDTEIGIQRYQYETALEGLGLTSLLRPDAGINMENGQGSIRLPQNMDFEFFVDITDSEKPWAKEIYVYYSYAHKDYFPGFGTAELDLEEVQQWQYTTSDGTPLSLALDRKGRGIILAESPDGMIYLDVDSNFSGPNFPEASAVMDRQGLEQIADAFDYSIQPHPADLADLQPKLDEDQKAVDERSRYIAAAYSGFTEFLLENAHFIPTRHYAFYDLDGDGTEEMIIGDMGANFTRILHDNQGEVHEHMWVCDFRILENGGFMTHESYSTEEGWENGYHFYSPLPAGEVMRFDYSGNGPEMCYGEWFLSVNCKNGEWAKFTERRGMGTAIQEGEAMDLLDQYPEKKLDWQPVWDYPVDVSGRTIGDELSSRKPPQTEEEYIQFYANAAKNGNLWLDDSHTHFVLRDINSDGILDLMTSRDGTSLDFSFTWKYGKCVSLASTFSYLCKENVMCSEFIRGADDGADLHHYTFTRFNGTTEELLADIEQNKASGIWTDQMTGEILSEEEAQRIIAQYPKVSMSFRPIEELVP